MTPHNALLIPSEANGPRCPTTRCERIRPYKRSEIQYSPRMIVNSRINSPHLQQLIPRLPHIRNIHAQPNRNILHMQTLVALRRRLQNLEDLLRLPRASAQIVAGPALIAIRAICGRILSNDPEVI